MSRSTLLQQKYHRSRLLLLELLDRYGQMTALAVAAVEVVGVAVQSP